MTRYFTKDHEWIKVSGKTGRVGISDFAQSQLGDVVYVDLPSIGKVLTQGSDAAVVESVKAASEVYAPISGMVSSVNSALSDEPSLVNAGAETNGWFFELSISDETQLSELMDESEYKNYIAGLA